MNARGRPRIPTPDVQKDGVIDKDSKQNISGNGTIQPGTYPPDIPAVVQVVYKKVYIFTKHCYIIMIYIYLPTKYIFIDQVPKDFFINRHTIYYAYSYYKYKSM